MCNEEHCSSMNESCITYDAFYYFLKVADFESPVTSNICLDFRIPIGGKKIWRDLRQGFCHQHSIEDFYKARIDIHKLQTTQKITFHLTFTITFIPFVVLYAVPRFRVLSHSTKLSHKAEWLISIILSRNCDSEIYINQLTNLPTASNDSHQNIHRTGLKCHSCQNR